jgi:hypothetical protein
LNDLSQSSMYSLKERARLRTHVPPALIIDTNGPALRSHSMRSTEKQGSCTDTYDQLAPCPVRYLAGVTRIRRSETKRCVMPWIPIPDSPTFTLITQRLAINE